MQRFTLFLFLLIPLVPAWAQSPGVEVRFEARVLEPGESVDLQLVCTNTGMPSAPEVQVPDGLSVELLSSAPAVFSQTSIVNGRRSQSTTYTFTFRLSAQKEGTYTLGPFSVGADGSTFQTQPLTIEVKAADQAQAPKGDAYIFAEIEVAPTTVYVSQSIQATLTIGIRKVELNGRVQENLELLRIIDGTASQLSVFPRRGWTSAETTLTDSSGRRHRYDIFRVTAPLRAEEVGNTVIGPVFIKANYPTAVRQGFFGPEIARTRRETARAAGVVVTVKGAPMQGRPQDYSGAIGQYGMDVSAKPDRVELGQPVTLTISIKGAPLEGIAGPDLSTHRELTSRFDFTHEELTGDLEGRAKVFRRAIFPKQIGEQTVPGLSWSYFDPSKEQYVTLSSEPIDIEVEPSTGTTAVMPNDPAAGTHELELKSVTGGIAPNYVDPDELLADDALDFRPLSLGLIVAAPLAWAGLLGMERRRNRLRGDKGLARRRRALRVAEHRVRQALTQPQAAERAHQLARAVTGYVCDRFNGPSETLTTAEVQEILNRSGHTELAGDVRAFLERCDAARFAPASFQETTAETADRIRSWMRELERAR